MKVNSSTPQNVQNSEVSSGKKVNKNQAAYDPKKTSNTTAAADSEVKAEFTSKAKDFAKAKAVAAQAPDVREEKVAELKKRIAEGKYKVDADAVAGRMVDEHIKTAGLS